MPDELPDPIDPEITLPLSDLLVIRAALNSAWYQNTVIDLADQYRKMTARPQSSAITKALEGALSIADSRIQALREEEENAGER